MILFPNERVTSERMVEWCGDLINTERMRYTLQKHFQKNGVKRGRYYTPKN